MCRSGDGVDIASVLEGQGSDSGAAADSNDLLQGLLKLLRRDLGVRFPLLGRNSSDGPGGASLGKNDRDIVILADLLRGFPSSGCEVPRVLFGARSVKERVVIPGLASVASKSRAFASGLASHRRMK